MSKHFIKHQLNIIKSHYLALRLREFDYQHGINTVDMGFKTTTTYGVFHCQIEQLRASIPTENGKVLMKIEDTPVYYFMAALANQTYSEHGEQLYYDYLRYRSLTLNKDTFAQVKQRKIKLVESIRSDPNLDIGIVTRPPRYCPKSQTHTIKIRDGLHRSIILKTLGIKTMKCLVQF